MERLDQERLETLRQWGAGLEGDDRPEVRAAGRAILLLLDEIELLNVDLWHARTAGTGEPAAAATAEEPDVAATLRGRLLGRARSQPAG